MVRVIPRVLNFDTERIPVEGSSTFRADASYVWSRIPIVINTINDAGSAMNVLARNLLAIETNATNIQTDITTKQTDVTTKHDTVVAKEALVNPHYTAIDTVSANITAVKNVDTNMSVVKNVDTNITAVKNVDTNITAVKNIDTNITAVKNVDTNMSAVKNVDTNMSAVKNVDTNITAVQNINTNITAVKNVDTNMSVIQNAEQNALVAQSSANYKGDWVANYNTTGYSLADSVTYTDGKNYVSKVNSNLVEPTRGTNTTEWNFIEGATHAELALKANSANPVFTGSITEQVGTMVTAIDATLGTIQKLTMTADTTLTDSLLDGQSITLILTNGGFTITYPSITWVGGEEPKLSATDIIVFFKASGVLYGSWNGATAW